MYKIVVEAKRNINLFLTQLILSRISSKKYRFFIEVVFNDMHKLNPIENIIPETVYNVDTALSSGKKIGKKVEVQTVNAIHSNMFKKDFHTLL